jgi:hypothetical protein
MGRFKIVFISCSKEPDKTGSDRFSKSESDGEKTIIEASKKSAIVKAENEELVQVL